MRTALLAGCALLLATACTGQRGSLQPQDSPFTRLDRDGDGYLQRGELDPALRLAREYADWDRNADGRIDHREFRRYRGFAMD